MDTTQLIIYGLFVCINSAVLFLIYGIISRWIARNEKKIDNLEHQVLSIDDYIRYTTHIIESVYIDVQNRLMEHLASEERYEEAEYVRQNRDKTIGCVLKEMRERLMKDALQDFINNKREENSTKKGSKES